MEPGDLNVRLSDR